MRDNLHSYRAIRAALRQGYPGEPQGQCARHVTTVAALISGMVASKGVFARLSETVHYADAGVMCLKDKRRA